MTTYLNRSFVDIDALTTWLSANNPTGIDGIVYVHGKGICIVYH